MKTIVNLNHIHQVFRIFLKIIIDDLNNQVEAPDKSGVENFLLIFFESAPHKLKYPKIFLKVLIVQKFLKKVL